MSLFDAACAQAENRAERELKEMRIYKWTDHGKVWYAVRPFDMAPPAHSELVAQIFPRNKVQKSGENT